ncbi:MAG: hypothetical protein AAF591_12615 [Verrucomicrobiota bacterium]
MLQVIFNEISAAEISQLSTTDQLELLAEFKVTPEDLESPDNERFGAMTREGKTLYRYRSPEYRIYFEVSDEGVVVHRVLHKNTLEDFLFRTKLDSGEDAALAESKQFWELIEEGEKARRV